MYKQKFMYISNDLYQLRPKGKFSTFVFKNELKWLQHEWELSNSWNFKESDWDLNANWRMKYSNYKTSIKQGQDHLQVSLCFEVFLSYEYNSWSSGSVAFSSWSYGGSRQKRTEKSRAWIGSWPGIDTVEQQLNVTSKKEDVWV